jgi:hypothetical protein
MEPISSKPLNDEKKPASGAKGSPAVGQKPPGHNLTGQKAQPGAIYGTGSGTDQARYRKIKGPRKKRFQLPKITLASILRIETLLVLVTLAAAFVIAGNLLERATREYIVRENTLVLATALRDVAYNARETHKFIELRADPGSVNKLSFYKLVVRGEKVEIKTMPVGVTITGDVIFDPYGCPNRATKFTVRKGSSVLSIDINNRGKVTVPD